jgi:secernin
MCDTLVALANSTRDGSVIFGKNSDRPQSEAQIISYIPRKNWIEKEIQCTYISIPQVKETASVILSQPFWMWGAEMGANEYGVVIGNEAVYSYEPVRDIGLLGMDLVRLGLERGKNAIESVQVITSLLEKYHQGGGCAFNESNWSYHNSFIIADPKEAYVLEAADDWWIVEKVINVRSISNGLTIRGKGDSHRRGIIQYAIERGYCKDDQDFDFALTFSGSNGVTPFSRGGKSKKVLLENATQINQEMMMDFLREHEAGICMHGNFESTGSQVSYLKSDECHIHWFTGSTLPCLSIYKPYHFPADEQVVLPPGPYPNVNQNWIWARHSNFIKHGANLDYKEKIGKLETNIKDQINDIINNCSTRTRDEVNKEVTSLNQQIWKSTQSLIE